MNGPAMASCRGNATVSAVAHAGLLPGAAIPAVVTLCGPLGWRETRVFIQQSLNYEMWVCRQRQAGRPCASRTASLTSVRAVNSIERVCGL